MMKHRNDNWKELQHKLKLFQVTPNAVWCTSNTIFCDATKKQIWRAYVVMIGECVKGVYDCSVLQKICQQFLVNNKWINICIIESDALPIKKTMKIERGKMTDTLRFKILKRDKFTCKACGSKAGDVKLHIDHIIPISKGGQTIDSNLQALCAQCNMGKSNK